MTITQEVKPSLNIMILGEAREEAEWCPLQ